VPAACKGVGLGQSGRKLAKQSCRRGFRRCVSGSPPKTGDGRFVTWICVSYARPPFLFYAHSANLRPPREGRAHAPDSHTHHRCDRVRRGPGCPARLPVRVEQGDVELHFAQIRSHRPDGGRSSGSGTSALSGASPNARSATAID